MWIDKLERKISVNQEIEIEFKNIILEEEFERIANLFSFTSNDFIVQENHYFDTHDYKLKSLESALRIRHKRGKYELTLKQPTKEGLLETNQPLTMEEAGLMLQGRFFPSGKINQILTEINVEPDHLHHFGTLKTARAEKVYKGGLLVLDHSFYLNTEDFELEYEVTNKLEGQEIFSELLQTLQIPDRQTENKVRRFYRAKFS
jgi:uncharacterized protein YjbK